MPGHKHLVELHMKQNCLAGDSHLLCLATAQLCHTPLHPTDTQLFLCQVRKDLCCTYSTSLHAIKANLWLLELDVADTVTFEPYSHTLEEHLHCPVEFGAQAKIQLYMYIEIFVYNVLNNF